MQRLARLADGPFEPAAELEALTRAAAAKSAGAVVSFTGLARPAAIDGTRMERLVLDYHPRLTRQSLDDIATDALTRFDVAHVRVVHRCGAILPGEPIVFVGAASAHRQAAFEAADYLMDRLKTEAVFWKREDGPRKSHWIEPTEGDYATAARWE